MFLQRSAWQSAEIAIAVNIPIRPTPCMGPIKCMPTVTTIGMISALASNTMQRVLPLVWSSLNSISYHIASGKEVAIPSKKAMTGSREALIWGENQQTTVSASITQALAVIQGRRERFAFRLRVSRASLRSAVHPAADPKKYVNSARASSSHPCVMDEKKTEQIGPQQYIPRKLPSPSHVSQNFPFKFICIRGVFIFKSPLLVSCYCSRPRIRISLQGMIATWSQQGRTSKSTFRTDMQTFRFGRCTQVSLTRGVGDGF